MRPDAMQEIENCSEKAQHAYYMGQMHLDRMELHLKQIRTVIAEERSREEAHRTREAA